MGFLKTKIIDCHVHFEDIDHADLMISILKEARFERMNIVSAVSSFRVNFNPEAIYMKTVHPEFFYAFGGLDYSSVSSGSGEAEPSLIKQVDAMRQVGFDGIKMVEGKQTERKRLNIPFDSKFYKEYFEYVESLQYPLLFHVNDPEEYWDLDQIPSWAIQRGWFYDETFPTREQLYNEVGNVLENCPDIKVIFAHFYFLSADIERASKLLDDYKGVHLDLTPDPVMY
ncbi:MAG: amidohydrolase family protein, partial [Nitrososphaerota archaeon]